MTILALQTDSRGVTGVLLEGGKLVGLATVPRAESAEQMADALRQAIPPLRGAKPSVAVALGPDEARVRRLAVPPAPEAELPPIVALQAAREAAAEPESLVADFLPPEPGADGKPSTLVAWATAETLAYWGETAESLGGKLVAATPRPLAATPDTPDQGPRLYASRAGDALDFVAFRDGHPVLLRSASGAVDRELNRTRLALSSLGIESPEVTPLQTDLLPGQENPVAPAWPEIDSPDLIDAALYEQALAATGLAARVASQAKPLINLADPRKEPVRENGHRCLVLLAAAAASVLAAGAWMAYDRVADLDRQIEDKRAEIAEARRDAEAFEPHRQRVATLDTWRATDVVWLDEIDRLAQSVRPKPFDAEDFPAERDARLTRLAATIATGRDAAGGKIDLTALLKTPSVNDLEGRFREAGRPLSPKSVADRPAEDAYRYQYTADLRVPGEPREEDSP